MYIFLNLFTAWTGSNHWHWFLVSKAFVCWILPCDTTQQKKRVVTSTSSEKKAFLTALKSIYPKAVVLTTVFKNETQTSIQTTSTVSKPSRRNPSIPVQTLPRTMMSLYDPVYRSMPASEFDQECNQIFHKLSITEESKFLANSTSLQSMSNTWHEHRLGRITASRFGQACRTNPQKPSKSLVDSILTRSQFSSQATQWGNRQWRESSKRVCRRSLVKTLVIHLHYNRSGCEPRFTSEKWTPEITPFPGTRSLLLTRDDTHGVTSLLRWQAVSIRSNQILYYKFKVFMS